MTNIKECGYEVEDGIVYMGLCTSQDDKENNAEEIIRKFSNDYENGTKGIVATCLVNNEDRQEFEEFLGRNGFSFPVYQERLVSLDINELKKTYLGKLSDCSSQYENRIVKFNSLRESEKKHIYRILADDGVMYDWNEENSKIVDELSYAFCEGERIASCVIFTEEENTLCLKAAYNGNGGIGIIPIFWKVCQMLIADNNNYTEMAINAINDKSYQLLAKLLSGAKMEKKLVTTVRKIL